jgi:protocatechuate 4,5-dioxygenase alpha chain
MRTRLYPLADLEDIPGTKVFTAKRSRQAYHLHKFCMSLMKAENREAFRKDERAYLDDFGMTEEQKQAPATLVASKQDATTGEVRFTRPLCEYPAWPRYDGKGDVSRASSFACVAD